MAFSSKLVYGVGTKGDDVTVVNGKQTKVYKTWTGMLERCYSPRYQKLHPTYIGCSVCAEWLQYHTFKQWFDVNYVEGWDIDKDLLVDGNKEYGPDTCIFVPHQINSLFTDCGRARGDYLLGVSLKKRAGELVAHVRVDGKKQHLGYFTNANEAHKAYLIAKKENVLRTAEKWKEKIPTKLYDALIRKANELINIDIEGKV